MSQPDRKRCRLSPPLPKAGSSNITFRKQVGTQTQCYCLPPYHEASSTIQDLKRNQNLLNRIRELQKEKEKLTFLRQEDEKRIKRYKVIIASMKAKGSLLEKETQKLKESFETAMALNNSLKEMVKSKRTWINPEH